MSDLRLGLIGSGRVAERGYAPAIAGLPGVELAAAADPVPERARRVAALAGGSASPRVHASAAELLAAGDLDAVVVASPVERHHTDAALAARAGVPCLVEKPPAADARGAGMLASLRPPPWIGFNRRFLHAAGLLDRVPHRGGLEVGVEIRYRRETWSPHGELGDALLDLGPHAVDLAVLLAGGESAAVASARVGERAAELELTTGRGPAVIRCATDRPHRERVEVRRPGGRRIAVSTAGGLGGSVAARLAWREQPLVVSLRRQLEALAQAARGRDPGPLGTAADGLRVMSLIDAAREAA